MVKTAKLFRRSVETAVLIPVYNEGQVIRDVVDNVSRHFTHVICVDDGSTDNSASEIEKTNAYLIKHPINMGQGAALQTAIEFSRQLPVDYFVTFDADGQHRLKDVQLMLTEIKNSKKDIILGSRFLGSSVGMKKSKYLLLKAAIRFSNATSGLRLTDTHNGLRVFNRRIAEGIQITLPDMAHASEILDTISKQGYTYKEVPVTIDYTEYSLKKGQSLINAVNISFDTLLKKVNK